jgi:hypothetical protein
VVVYNFWVTSSKCSKLFAWVQLHVFVFWLQHQLLKMLFLLLVCVFLSVISEQHDNDLWQWFVVSFILWIQTDPNHCFLHLSQFKTFNFFLILWSVSLRHAGLQAHTHACKHTCTHTPTHPHPHPHTHTHTHTHLQEEKQTLSKSREGNEWKIGPLIQGRTTHFAPDFLTLPCGQFF